MDNDNKVIIQKPEVRLFLENDMDSLVAEKPIEYNLEEEFAKTKKNKSFFIPLAIFIASVVVLFAVFGISKYIAYANSQITVEINAFDDLNLKKLLNGYARVEDSLKDATNKKSILQKNHASDIAQAKLDYENEVYTIKSLRLKNKTEENRRLALIENNYKKELQRLNDAYNADLVALEVEIEELTKQMTSFNNSELEKAQEREMIIDSQQKLFDLEKQQIQKEYQQRIARLQDKIQENQRLSFEQQKKAVDEVTKKYTQEIALLDPLVQDSVVLSILEKYDSTEKRQSFFNFFDETKTTENSFLQDTLLHIELLKQQIISDYGLLLAVSQNIPYENTLPKIEEIKKGLLLDYEYLLKAQGKAYSKEIEKIEKSYQEQLKSKEAVLSEKNDLIDVYQDYFATLAQQNESSSIVMDTKNLSKMLVFIVPETVLSADELPVYVYRKNTFVSVAQLKKEGQFYFIYPLEGSKMDKIQVNDRILFEKLK